MSDYYRAIILATRSSANAIAAMSRINRKLADARRAGQDCTALKRAYTNAYVRYHKAQQILDSHLLSAADIAARQRDYPAPRK